MSEWIELRATAGFQRLELSTLSGLERTLSPIAQKGGDGTYTCVGLVEAASEASGHNSGAGFIPNAHECSTVSILGTTHTIPFLSPELLNWSVKNQPLIDSANQSSLTWIKGLAFAQDSWRTIEFESSEVTGASVTVSPDDEWLVFTILGHLLRLPVEGARLSSSRSGRTTTTEPMFSPDGVGS